MRVAMLVGAIALLVLADRYARRRLKEELDRIREDPK